MQNHDETQVNNVSGMPEMQKRDDALFEALGKSRKRKKRRIILTIVSILLIAAVVLRVADILAAAVLCIAIILVCSTVLPYLFYTAGLSKVESGKAAILASLEPVVASVMGVAVFGEPMDLFMVLGIALVLFGVAILR